MLITQPLEYPLRCVTLLLRTILILFQDTVDNTDERIELRADRRPRPDITRWHRIAQHLPDRARVDPQRAACRVGSADHYPRFRQPGPYVPLASSTTAFDAKAYAQRSSPSGATRRFYGRFTPEGSLLRRSPRAPTAESSRKETGGFGTIGQTRATKLWASAALWLQINRVCLLTSRPCGRSCSTE